MTGPDLTTYKVMLDQPVIVSAKSPGDAYEMAVKHWQERTGNGTNVKPLARVLPVERVS